MTLPFDHPSADDLDFKEHWRSNIKFSIYFNKLRYLAQKIIRVFPQLIFSICYKAYYVLLVFNNFPNEKNRGGLSKWGCNILIFPLIKRAESETMPRFEGIETQRHLGRNFPLRVWNYAPLRGDWDFDCPWYTYSVNSSETMPRFEGIET